MSDHKVTVMHELEKKKSLEQNVISLRQELQFLYESLKNKNEQLMNLEKDIYERDFTIKCLRNDCGTSKDITQPVGSAPQTCSTCLKKINPDVIKSSLLKELKDRDTLIQDLNQKVIRLSDNLIFVQKESLSKNDKIDDLMHEIDKFRQVVINSLEMYFRIIQTNIV